MARKDLVVRFAGEGGQGMLTSTEALVQAATQVGYHVQTYATFPSQILGGPTWAQTRVSTSPVLSPGDDVDVLVAFNRDAYDAHKDDVRRGGVVIFDSGQFSLDGVQNTFGMPFDELARATGNVRAANMVVVAAIAHLVAFPHEALGAYNVRKFTRGRPSDEQVIRSNAQALAAGRDQAAKSGFRLEALEEPPAVGDRSLMTGNHAIAFGAAVAGVDFYAGYPISPATSILVWMEQNLPALGRFVHQTSSEIESINAIVGAGFAGKKAMTATAGPGLSLMVEGLGLAWMAEVPLVVADIQRGGPSTGLPTKTEQSDLWLALSPGHGDVRVPVIAPGTVEECFYAAITAVNWAERYQGPVIILSEHQLSDRQQDIPKPDLNSVTIENRLVYGGGDGHRRYEAAGLSPMPIPGSPGSYSGNGSEHDSVGDTTHLPWRHTQMTERRFGKLKLLTDGTYESENQDADMVMLPWGASKGPAREAYERLVGEGVDLGWRYTMYLHPLPPALLEDLRRKRLVLVPELNYLGQLSSVLRSEGVRAESITQYTGMPFKVRDLVNRLRERAQAHQTEGARA